METTTLFKLQKTIHAMKNQLLKDETIRKLLVHSSPNALSMKDVDRDRVKPSILTIPYINEEDPDKELNLNTFIAIYQTSIAYENEEDVSFLITAIYTNHEIYELDNNNFRLNMIGASIESALQNQKFNLTGQLNLYGASFVSLANSKKLGLILSWEVVNG